jgi:pimeloyl-ACP methyl ester carboxylesterase
MDNWNETFIGILALEYHVYTYDNRGMGLSSDNNVTHTIPLHADGAASLISDLGFDSCKKVLSLTFKKKRDSSGLIIILHSSGKKGQITDEMDS